MKSERGFTLVELMIYSMLSVIVLVIVGGILINSLTAERIVRSATEASTAGQLVAQSIGHGVRNASAITLSAPTPDTQLLMVRTVGPGATAEWLCQAWYFGASEVRTTTSSVGIPPPAASGAGDWTLLGDGMQPASPAPVFTVTDRRVDLNFEVSTGGGPPVLISTSAVSRQPIPATGVESQPCF